MRESNTHIDLGIPQSLRAGKQSMHLGRFDPVSAETTGSVQAVEPLLDCAGAAVVLGGLHPKQSSVGPARGSSLCRMILCNVCGSSTGTLGPTEQCKPKCVQ